MRNYVLVIDRSGSMSSSVSNINSKSRWGYCQEAVKALAVKCDSLDDDGIDVYIFNSSFHKFSNVKADTVDTIFNTKSPTGGTDFIPVLTEVFNTHFAQVNDKPTTVVVITDGEPSSGATGRKDLVNLIINTSQKMEADSELGISFIQVGDDSDATKFLNFLDDELVSMGAKFDIVDTKTIKDLEHMELEDVLLAAIND